MVDKKPLGLALFEHIQVRIRGHAGGDPLQIDRPEPSSLEARYYLARDFGLGKHAVDHAQLVVYLHRAGLMDERTRLSSRFALPVEQDRFHAELREAIREHEAGGPAPTIKTSVCEWWTLIRPSSHQACTQGPVKREGRGIESAWPLRKSVRSSPSNRPQARH